MLDARYVRQNPDIIRTALENRGATADLDEFLRLDEDRRNLLFEVERLKSLRNQESEEIARKKKAGKPADEIIARMKEVSQNIKDMDEKISKIEADLREILLTIPNIPDDSVPVGKTDADNVEVRRWGEPTKFDFDPKPHWDIGEDLDILDFERAKDYGSRFAVTKVP